MGGDLFNIALMKKFGGSGGGVSSWNDLTDKPFNIVELMPETQFVYVADYGNFIAQTDFELVADKTYIINWNGVEYTGTAKTVYYNGGFMVAVGNEAFSGGEDNGLPFVVARQMFDDFLKGIMFAVPLDGSTSITVGVKGVESSPLYDNSNALVFDTRFDWNGATQKVEPTVLYVTPEQIYSALAADKKVCVLAPTYLIEGGSWTTNGMQEVPLVRAWIEQGIHLTMWGTLSKSGFADQFGFIAKYNDDGTYIYAPLAD